MILEVFSNLNDSVKLEIHFTLCSLNIYVAALLETKSVNTEKEEPRGLTLYKVVTFAG